MTKTRLLLAAAVVAVLVAVAVAAWSVHQRREDDRALAAAAAAHAEAGRAIDGVELPATFTSLPCDPGQEAYDRCWRAEMSAEDAATALETALEAEGVRGLERDCTTSPKHQDKVLACALTGSIVFATASQDLRTSADENGDIFLDTSTVAAVAQSVDD